MQPCSRCGDLGILRLQANGTKEESLCYCVCLWSRQPAQIWKLPRLSRSIEDAFEVSKCPLAWFLPDNERESVPRDQLIASIGAIAERWRTQIRRAEEFWREYAPVFDLRPRNTGPDGPKGAA